MELILKEKDYRTALKEFDFSVYENNIVAVHCSTDAIIPHWAFMLAAVYIQPFASNLFFGSPANIKKDLLLQNLRNIETEQYSDKRMVIKGCGEEDMDTAAYLEITKTLLPVAKSIMYGEPCSTVPIYKKSKI